MLLTSNQNSIITDKRLSGITEHLTPGSGHSLPHAMLDRITATWGVVHMAGS